MDSDKKWEILNDLLNYIGNDEWDASSVSFFLRHEYIVTGQYPMAVVADPSARLVGMSHNPRTLYGEQTLITIKGRELRRKLESSTERIIAIKELIDLIDEDKFYEEETNNNV
jgi:hypothetical protein